MTAAQQEALMKLTVSPDDMYTGIQVLNELELYSSYLMVVPVGVTADAAYFAGRWTEYRKNTIGQLHRAWKAMQADYDPISNYDMIEQSADGRKLSKRTDTTTPTGGTESTTYRYGLGSDADGSKYMKEEAKPIAGAKTELTEEYMNDKSMTFDGSTLTGYHDAAEHYLKRSGNIGVTTSAQMIEGELQIRVRDLLREYIKEFIDRYCFCVGGDV